MESGKVADHRKELSLDIWAPAVSSLSSSPPSPSSRSNHLSIGNSSPSWGATITTGIALLIITSELEKKALYFRGEVGQQVYNVSETLMTGYCQVGN